MNTTPTPSIFTTVASRKDLAALKAGDQVVIDDQSLKDSFLTIALRKDVAALKAGAQVVIDDQWLKDRKRERRWHFLEAMGMGVAGAVVGRIVLNRSWEPHLREDHLVAKLDENGFSVSHRRTYYQT